ncbi:hypothetical protein Naga_100533g7 [Nannochloropsis gaditana]|uniref:Uncharacterized protein n=1 Tax=Nannochloropsis gaditana TaxID=72520 RepID=W7SZD1_9STRA|nr:hypothetical protein Naga_100533g7 [Nannochloropsis gaditana]
MAYLFLSATILQCCTYILYGSNSLYRDVLIAIVSCHGLRPPNHLYVILLYDNRTGVDQCLWLSLICLWLSWYTILGFRTVLIGNWIC